jgi:hypothetical protein
MGIRVKTTIELSDELARKAKRYAARHGLTLRAIVEEGIRLRLAEPEQPSFELRDASVGGQGLQPDFREEGWSKLRQAAYEDRGG